MQSGKIVFGAASALAVLIAAFGCGSGGGSGSGGSSGTTTAGVGGSATTGTGSTTTGVSTASSSTGAGGGGGCKFESDKCTKCIEMACSDSTGKADAGPTFKVYADCECAAQEAKNPQAETMCEVQYAANDPVATATHDCILNACGSVCY